MQIVKPYFKHNKKWYEFDHESGKNLIIRLLQKSRNWENRWKWYTGEWIKTWGEIIFFVYNQSCKKKKKIKHFSHLCSLVKKKNNQGQVKTRYLVFSIGRDRNKVIQARDSLQFLKTCWNGIWTQIGRSNDQIYSNSYSPLLHSPSKAIYQ